MREGRKEEGNYRMDEAKEVRKEGKEEDRLKIMTR